MQFGSLRFTVRSNNSCLLVFFSCFCFCLFVCCCCVVDVYKQNGIVELQLLWLFKIFLLYKLQVVICLILLYLKMSYSSLLGACIFLLVVPIQFLVANTMSKLEKETLVRICCSFSCYLLYIYTLYQYHRVLGPKTTIGLPWYTKPLRVLYWLLLLQPGTIHAISLKQRKDEFVKQM